MKKKNLLLWEVLYTKGFSVLCLCLFLIAAASCKDDDDPTPGTQSLVEVTPGGSNMPQGTVYYFYDKASGEFTKYDAATDGTFSKEMAFGDYAMLATNTNAEGVTFDGMDDFATATVTAISKVNEGNRSVTIYLQQPGAVYSVSEETFTVKEGQGTKLTPTTRLLTQTITISFDIEESLATNIDYFMGTINGVHSAVNLTTGEPTTNAVANSANTLVSFDTTTDATRASSKMSATISVLGLQKPDASLPDYTPTLDFWIMMKDGSYSRKNIDLTDALNDADLTGSEIELSVAIDDATLVRNGDDLAAMLALAKEGEVFAIMPGEFALGEFTLTKSIKLKGVKSTDKPVIKGSFKVNSTIASLSLSNVIMEGSTSVNYPFNLNNSGCNIATISISDSELNNYARGLFYAAATNIIIGDITISNTIIKNMNPTGSSGGEGIDMRNTTGNSLGSITAENVTFDTGFRTFIRMQVPSTPKLTFRNCTFYKVCTPDNSNNTGLFRITTGTLEVSKCLFVETGPTTSPVTNTSSGNWTSSAANMGATTTYSDNYYYNCHNLWVGYYTDPVNYPATEANPGFADAANGNFTLSNTDLINAGIGDARWRQ